MQIGFFEHQETPEIILGIDLGTTNSVAAYCLPDGQVQVVDILTKPLVPSVVTYRLGDWVVGYDAQQDPQAVYSIKRLMGKTYEEVCAMGTTLAIRSGEQGVQVRVQEQWVTPVELSSQILKAIRSKAELSLGVMIKNVVITVPAYFNDAARQATRLAARLAGLEVVRMMNEPTAAALAFGLDKKEHGCIAVYDLGGGTFDVSVLQLHQGVFDVLSTSGHTFLGGDDIDHILLQDFQSRYQLNVLPEDVPILLGLCKTVKMDLSTASRAEVCYKGVLLQMERDHFEALLDPFLETTHVLCQKALQDANIMTTDLTDVVLVGGVTRIPKVQAFVQKVFSRVPNVSMHPDLVVAQGAALQAGVLSGVVQKVLLLDIVPLTLGIETYGGLFEPLIMRNSKIPTVAKQIFTTFVDYQTSVEVHVLQGEFSQVSQNISLARLFLKNIVPQKAGVPRIEVSFLIDADGLLQVSAEELGYHKVQMLQVRPSVGLSEQHIEAMLLRSQEELVKDQSFKKFSLLKLKAQKALEVGHITVQQASGYASQELLSVAKDAISALERAIESADIDFLERAILCLEETVKPLLDVGLTRALRDAPTVSFDKG